MTTQENIGEPQTLRARTMVWNLKDGFSDPARALPLTRRILELSPDIAAFPEAAIDGEVLSDDVVRPLRDAGYAVHETDYKDADGRRDSHKLAVLIKQEIQHDPYVVNLAGRSGLLLHLSGPQVDFLAFHNDDRREDTRRIQTTAAISLLGPSAVAAMDANSMHATDLRARALRAIGPVANLLPAADPQRGVKQPRLERIGSLLQRTVGMASGGSVELWEQAGFVDTVGNAATMTLGGRRAFSLDRIFVRGDDMQTISRARVVPPKGLSDHCAVIV